MPIYEYECSNCKHHFELMQKISDPVAKQCPKCYMESVTRLISPAGFQLKGTGWYATDYKNKSTPSSSEKKSADEPNASERSNTESKPATGKGESD